MNVGLDVKGEWLAQDQHPESLNDTNADRRRRGELLGSVQRDANFELQMATAAGKLRLWQAIGEDWREPPVEWAIYQLMNHTEESTRFFLQGDQMRDFLARYPTPVPSLSDSKGVLQTPLRSDTPRKRGRRSLAEYDALLMPIIDGHLATGRANPLRAAVSLVLRDAKGDGTELSIIERLEDRYREWAKDGRNKTQIAPI